MRFKGEKTFWGENIRTPEEFIEDLCDRIVAVYNTFLDVSMEGKKESQRSGILGFIMALRNRLNRVCERH